MKPDNEPLPPLPGLPFDLPFAWSNDPANPQVSRVFDSSSVTDDSPPSTPSASSRHHHVGPRRLVRLRHSLSDRDRAVLDVVAAHRYLTTRQVEGFCFHDHASQASGSRTARRVLRRLWQHGLIQPLERRVGGVRAGSASYVWQLGTVGYRLLREDGNRNRTHEPSPRFLAHSLTVADVHLALMSAQRSGPLTSVLVENEPASWRTFTGLGGERRTLKPDLFVVTRQDRYVDRWFLEVDLGTESTRQILTKCAQYEAYRATGSEQSSAGVFPLVVWQVPTKERLELLQATVSRSADLLPRLFCFVLPDGLVPLVTGGAI